MAISMDKKREARDHGGLGSPEKQTRRDRRVLTRASTLGKIIILYNSARKDYDRERVSLRSSERLARAARSRNYREREREREGGGAKEV